MESGRVSCVAFREGAVLVKGFLYPWQQVRGKQIAAALDIPVPDVWGIRGSVVSGLRGHIWSRSPSVKYMTHGDATGCTLGKLNERFTVPSEVDAGHVRPGGCVEKGERAEQGQLQCCLG